MDIKNSEKLLESSYYLEKLSLSQFHLSSKLISIISLQNSKTLKVLDLSECSFCTNENNCSIIYGLNVSNCVSGVPFEQIVENCTELKELSLEQTELCEKSINFLVSNLTSKIEKLDLFDQTALSDKHVKKLVSRCNKIAEINLGGSSSITRQSLNFIVENLNLTLVKLSLGSAFLEYFSSDLFKLKTMRELRLLCFDYDYRRKPKKIKWLKKMLPNLQIETLSGNITIANKSNLTEEIQVSRRASDQGSYAKPLLVQALSSHLRVWSAKSLSQSCLLNNVSQFFNFLTIF